MKSIKRNILLNPGPVTTTDTVKYAQVISDICPREIEFGDVMEYISKELTGFVTNNGNYTTVLFGGSGTAAVESILSSVIPDNGCILIINNGAYGERMCQIAKAFEIDYIELKSSPIDAIDLQNIENIMKANSKKISHLAIVHNETTTGLLNDISKIGDMCKKYNIEMIVDAISSYGAIPINMQNMNVSYLVATSNKNLQGMPGLSFVISKIDSLEKIKNYKTKNFYLNLYKQYEYFIKNHQTRFTPPVQTIYALKQAIIETKEETIEGRYRRYSKSWETLINGLDKMGMKHLVNRENHSKIITAVVEPNNEKYNFKNMHDFLLEKGYTIYPGKLDNLNTFRVSNIGNIDNNDIENFLANLQKYFEIIGQQFPIFQ